MSWFTENAPTPVSAAAAPIPGGNTIEQQARTPVGIADPNQPPAQTYTGPDGNQYFVPRENALQTQVRQRPDMNQPMAQTTGGGTMQDLEHTNPEMWAALQSGSGGGSQDYSHLAQNPEEAQFIQRIVEAQIAGYGGVRPGQVEYYLGLYRDPSQSSAWATGEPGRTMPDYWVERAQGMGAGDEDTATAGKYAGQNFGSLAYQQAGGNPFAGPGDGGMMGTGLPPGYTIGDIYGGGKYPLSSFGGVGLNKPFTAAFQRPTVTDDPGFQFRMNEGQKAIERSAAANGTLLSGGFMKDLLNYAQGLGSQEYQNAYGRDWNEYLTAYNIYDRNQANTFGRLNTLAQLGQNSAALSSNANTAYGRAGSDLITGMGNVDAQNAINQGNIITGALPTVGTLIDSWRNGGGGNRQPAAPPPTGTTPPFITSGPDRLGHGIEFG